MILGVENLTKRYAGSDRDVLRGVTFSIEPGETLALVGESGSGKSTIARLVARLDRPSSGRIVFEGFDITTLSRRELLPIRRRMQIVLQDSSSALDPRMTVGAAIEEAFAIHGLAAATAKMLERVHLEPALESRYPHELSGGQRQRVAIARALAVEPKFLILDEPLSALDLVTQSRLIGLFEELRSTFGLTYLLISHDLRAVRRLATRVVMVEDGRVSTQSASSTK